MERLDDIPDVACVFVATDSLRFHAVNLLHLLVLPRSRVLGSMRRDGLKSDCPLSAPSDGVQRERRGLVQGHLTLRFHARFLSRPCCSSSPCRCA